MITNPYLKSVMEDVNSKAHDAVRIAKENDSVIENTEYDTVDDLEDELNSEVDDIRKALKNTEEDVYGNRYSNLELLFHMGCLFGEFKGKELEGSTIGLDEPKWRLYDTAYSSIYDEAKKLLWTIQNE